MIKFIRVKKSTGRSFNFHNINVNHIIDIYEVNKETHLLLTSELIVVKDEIEDILFQINNEEK